MVITEYENLAYSNVLIGLREVFDKQDYQILLTDLHTNPNLHGDAVDALVSMDVEAVVLFVEPANLNTEGLSIPAIVVGARETTVKGADLIYSNDYQGSQIVLEHLIKLGHKNIAHLSGLGGIAGNRRKAYVEIMQEQGMPRMVYGESQKTNQLGGYLATKELIASGKPFTAIYAANDYIAAGAISALAEVGKNVPGDISIVGYDNAPISREYAMKLTTVDDMGLELGRQAAEQILKHLEGNKSQKPKQIVIEPSLVIRKSTAKKK
jgi:DNA-binding LacI/PurR family transcriptional regulator